MLTWSRASLVWRHVTSRPESRGPGHVVTAKSRSRWHRVVYYSVIPKVTVFRLYGKLVGLQFSLSAVAPARTCRSERQIDRQSERARASSVSEVESQGTR